MNQNIKAIILNSLKGISQVIFIENALSGVIILIAISMSSWLLGLFALLSSIIGTLTGKICGANEDSLNIGLFGYNSVLTGMALTLFLTGSTRWVIALVCAAITAILVAAMMHIMEKTDIRILTFPYIIITWIMLLVPYRLESFKLSNSLVPQSLSQWRLHIEGETDWIEGIFSGIGQIFFIDNSFSGFLILVAVFVAGWRLCLYTLGGSILGLLIAFALGGEYSLIFSGLFGYNAVLACLAVAVVFNEDKHRFAPISGIFAAIFTVPLIASIDTFLLPYGLPALSMPYVLSTWIFLGARKVLSKV